MRTASRVDVSVDEIGDILRSELTPVSERYALLSTALGATLAGPLWATAALPAADTAAMDGFAVSGPGPQWRVLIGTCTAGRRSGISLSEGEAVRIATGALTPPGTTAVIRQESLRAVYAGGQRAVALVAGAGRRNDLRRRGESWLDGDELTPVGTRVGISTVSVAQSAETPIAMVRGPLRADVLLTGDEIRASGDLEPGQVRDALGTALPHYLGHCDIGIRNLTRLPDDRALLRTWFDLDTDAELAVTVGATGHGGADHLRSVLDEIGAHILIDGVRMRPGGSQLVARLPDGRVLLALPGNPLAAVAATLVTGRSLVGALTCRRESNPASGRLADAGAPDNDRTRVVPVRQVEGGVWRATRSGGTAHLAGLLQAQALALVPAGTGRGALVELLSLPN
ncbi:molybdopterin-binding protein [Nocardia sp. NPDC055321]